MDEASARIDARRFTWNIARAILAYCGPIRQRLEFEPEVVFCGERRGAPGVSRRTLRVRGDLSSFVCRGVLPWRHDSFSSPSCSDRDVRANHESLPDSGCEGFLSAASLKSV